MDFVFFVFFVCNQMLSIRSPLSPGSCMIDVSGQGGEMVSLEELARRAVDCGLKIHRDLGPGMLESVYEAVLAAKLTGLGHVVVRQKPIEIEYEGMILREGFRAGSSTIILPRHPRHCSSIETVVHRPEKRMLAGSSDPARLRRTGAAQARDPARSAPNPARRNRSRERPG